jgi:hypothetical protein
MTKILFVEYFESGILIKMELFEKVSNERDIECIHNAIQILENKLNSK